MSLHYQVHKSRSSSDFIKSDLENLLNFYKSDKSKFFDLMDHYYRKGKFLNTRKLNSVLKTFNTDKYIIDLIRHEIIEFLSGKLKEI